MNHLNAFCGAIVLAAVALAQQPVREPLYEESLRPRFHFTARYWDDYILHPQNHEEGWINDVCGTVYHDGKYHLFAQRWWSAWLHAVSTDLVHWKELRPAFGKGGEFGGTQSGGSVIDFANCSGLGVPGQTPMVAFWSSTDNENQCISYSLDNGLTWSKYAGNPVLTAKYRDPMVFWYEPDKKWVMILYGPAQEAKKDLHYGFNGEENDAHNLMAFNENEWVSSVVRVKEDGSVTVFDGNGRADGKINIDTENVSAEKFIVGGKIDGREFMRGDVAEILVYDRDLTDSQCSGLTDLLASDFGAAAAPKKGLLAHFTAPDGADGKSLTKWTDRTGRHTLLSDSESAPQIVSDGKAKAVRFSGSQSLVGGGILAAGDDSFTIAALWRRTGGDGSQVVCEQNGSRIEKGSRAAILSVCSTNSDAYLLYSSKNLLDWEQMACEISDSYECPDMFELPVEGTSLSKWLVIDGNGDYIVGSFDGEKFTPEQTKKDTDLGRNFYATRSFGNVPVSDGRRIQLAWMRAWDDYPEDMPFNQQLSFPCSLTLHKSNAGFVVYRYPVAEISSLWTEQSDLGSFRLSPEQNPFSSYSCDALDFEAVIDLTKTTAAKLKISMCGVENVFDFTESAFTSAGTDATFDAAGGKLKIRLLLDRLSLEAFVNDGEVSITNFIRQTSKTCEIEALSGNVDFDSLKLRKVGSMWKN
jgi:sucrose-6-phosphate hydrolase SacC (GH32 family)